MGKVKWIAGFLGWVSWGPIGVYGPTFTSSQDYWKNHSFDYKIVSKVMSLL